MIALSRLSKIAVAPAAVAALIVIWIVSGASCFGTSCNGTNCPIGLAVIFTPDDFDGSARPDELTIDIAEQKDQTFAPLMTCTLPLTGTMQMVCTGGDQVQHAVWGSSQLQFFDTKLGTFRVTVSAAGAQLSQRVYAPPYQTHKCGCGDFMTTSGFMTIDVPSQQQP
jgi:hypothetical protein